MCRNDEQREIKISNQKNQKNFFEPPFKKNIKVALNKEKGFLFYFINFNHPRTWVAEMSGANNRRKYPIQ